MWVLELKYYSGEYDEKIQKMNETNLTFDYMKYNTFLRYKKNKGRSTTVYYKKLKCKNTKFDQKISGLRKSPYGLPLVLDDKEHQHVVVELVKDQQH